VDILRSTYQDILRNATANAFTDGRTSSEYRRERQKMQCTRLESQAFA
jgi:putative hydrolase of the HAD superfamily